MVASVKQFVVVLLAGAVLVGCWPGRAKAQAVSPIHPTRSTFIPGVISQVNPNFIVGPGNLTLRQAAFNTAVLGRAASRVPPWLYGVNPGLGFNPALSGFGGFPAFGSPALTTGYGFPGGGFGGALATAPGGGAALSTLGGYGYGGGEGGYGGYGGGYWNQGWGSLYPSLDYSGYLRGAADVTVANATYWKIIQEARLARERANQEAQVTRRKILEEAEYERMEWMKRHDPEVVRQQDQEWWLNRARHDAPMTEVLSAQALNTLLQHLKNEQAKGERGPSVPLSQDLLKNVNVTGQDTRANVGLLKNNGKLDWPLPLQGSEFASSRDKFNKLIADAVQQSQFNNPVDPGKLNDMRAEVARMENTLDRGIRDNDLLPSEYLPARRYINQLSDAVKALEDPNASKYFTGKWVPKGQDVATLVQYMRENGLRFAPAVSGDTDAYLALYSALMAFDAGMSGARGSSGNGGGSR
jgi:hypothetical protein